VTNWVNAFHNGARDEDLIAGLMGSGEYFATRAGNGNNKWLAAAYLDLLNRPVDSGGQQAFGGQLAAGVPRSTVARELLSRDEYRRDLIVNDDEYRANLISQTFLKLLGRAAGAGDINIFLPLLRQPSAGPGSASPDEQFFAALAGSGEYFFRQTEPANGLHTNAQWVNSLY